MLVATDIVGTTLEQYPSGWCAQRVTARCNALDHRFLGVLRGVITCAVA